jgi:hypothetical protein
MDSSCVFHPGRLSGEPAHGGRRVGLAVSLALHAALALGLLRAALWTVPPFSPTASPVELEWIAAPEPEAVPDAPETEPDATPGEPPMEDAPAETAPPPAQPVIPPVPEEPVLSVQDATPVPMAKPKSTPPDRSAVARRRCDPAAKSGPTACPPAKPPLRLPDSARPQDAGTLLALPPPPRTPPMLLGRGVEGHYEIDPAITVRRARLERHRPDLLDDSPITSGPTPVVPPVIPKERPPAMQELAGP